MRWVGVNTPQGAEGQEKKGSSMAVAETERSSVTGRHIFRKYDEELEEVRTSVLAMGGLVEEQITNALAALAEFDSEIGERVVRDDYRINRLEVQIDGGVHADHRAPPARGERSAARHRDHQDDHRPRANGRRGGEDRPDRGPARRQCAAADALRGGAQPRPSRSADGPVRPSMRSRASTSRRRSTIAREDKTVDLEYAACMRELVTYMMEDPAAHLRGARHALVRARTSSESRTTRRTSGSTSCSSSRGRTSGTRAWSTRSCRRKARSDGKRGQSEFSGSDEEPE